MASLAVLLVAGCTAPSSVGTSPDAESEAERNLSDPVREEVPLYAGSTDKEWTFTVPDTATTGRLHVALEGMAGGAPVMQGSWCFAFRAPGESGQIGSCGSEASGVYLDGTFAPRALYERDRPGAPAGEYWFHFQSDRQAARLTVTLQAGD